MDSVMNSIQFLRAYLGESKTLQGEKLFALLEEGRQSIPEPQDL